MLDFNIKIYSTDVVALPFISFYFGIILVTCFFFILIFTKCFFLRFFNLDLEKKLKKKNGA